MESLQEFAEESDRNRRTPIAYAERVQV